jgi:hypothetical protein
MSCTDADLKMIKLKEPSGGVAADAVNMWDELAKEMCDFRLFKMPILAINCT